MIIEVYKYTPPALSISGHMLPFIRSSSYSGRPVWSSDKQPTSDMYRTCHFCWLFHTDGTCSHDVLWLKDRFCIRPYSECSNPSLMLTSDR